MKQFYQIPSTLKIIKLFYPNLTATNTTTNRAIVLHKIYLESAVFFFNLLLFIILLLKHYLMPLVTVYYYLNNYENCPDNTDGLHCQSEARKLNWKAENFEKVRQFLYPLIEKSLKMLNNSQLSDKVADFAGEKLWDNWTSYRVLWLLQVKCLCGAFVFEVIKRFQRMKHHTHDSATMFAMATLLFVTAICQMVQVFYYFEVINTLNVCLSELNASIYAFAIDAKIRAPIVFCMELSSMNFGISVICLFLVIFTITLIVDYLDPV